MVKFEICVTKQSYVQKTTHDELRSSMHTLGDRLGRLKKALNYQAEL